MQTQGWMFHTPGEKLRLDSYELNPGPGEVLVEVAGCGVCHTDLGYYYDGVPTRKPLPLVLGHEVAGTVRETGAGAESWLGAPVVVPAVIPCAHCPACEAGRGAICPKQIFPGCDIHGGFAHHLVVPAEGLCPVPNLEDPALNPAGLKLETLSVIADAVSTPYQALLKSGLEKGDLAIFVGVGGVGGFGVQVAAALGARVIALDLDDPKLEMMAKHGADLTFNVGSLDFRSLRRAIRDFAKAESIPTFRTKIFECSGSPAGQATAFGLLGHGGYLGVVGYTPRKVELRLSNLMALDATAQGNWGCLPEYYPAVVDLALRGDIALAPFVEYRSLDTINETFKQLHEGGACSRIILKPEL